VLDIEVGDKWCNIIFDPLFGDNGKLSGALLILRDITERKKNEEELKIRTKELERFNKTMIDRELRMVQLKKENMELLDKIDRMTKDKNE